MKTFYIVRHCQADGQSKDAALTPQGITQSHELAQFFPAFISIKLSQVLINERSKLLSLLLMQNSSR